jgi:hypothetical protein
VSTAQAILLLIAVGLLVVAAFRPPLPVSLALLGAAVALLAYSLPTVEAGL